MSRWFRFYDDAMWHPKVLSLRDSEFRTWAALLCLASREKAGGFLPDEVTIGKALSIKAATIRQQTSKLIATGLLLRDGDRLRIHNWEKHQYKSDVSSGRMRRLRAKSDVTVTAAVTAPETESEKDSPQTPLNELPLAHPTAAPSVCDSKLNGSGAKPTNGTANGAAKAVAEKAIEIEFAAWWAPWPRKQDRGHALKAYRAARKKASAELLLGGAKRARIAYAGTEPRFIPLAATWLNGERWADETAQQTNQDWRSVL